MSPQKSHLGDDILHVVRGVRVRGHNHVQRRDEPVCRVLCRADGGSLSVAMGDGRGLVDG